MAGHWSDRERAQRWDSGHLEGNPIRGPHLDLLVELIGEASPGWCLDLGCGSGLVAELVLDRWPDRSIFGADSSAPMLEMARERLARFGDRVRLSQADLSEIDQVSALDPPGCTAAIAVQALHHLHRPDLEGLLAWTRQRLGPDGLVAIIDPVLIPSRLLYRSFRRAKSLAGWKWNPDTFEEYRGGLSEGHDRLLALEDYLAVLRGIGFDAACIDLRADRALIVGRL